MRESPFWAFLSAHGALLIVAGILHFVLLAAPRAVTDPAMGWPFGATLASMITFVSSIVAGVVLVRAGGAPAIGYYVAFALVEALASLPGFLLFCERSDGDAACYAPVFYIGASRAPQWLGAAIGVVAGLRVGRAADDGANRMLRGAGVFGVAQFLLIAPLSYVSYGVNDQQLQSALFLIAYGIAGVVAGLFLRDARPAAVVLVALVIVAPTLGLSLPLVRNAGPGEAIEVTVMRLATLLAPAVGGACLLGARHLARRRTTL
jgi:hypothetical protein